MRTWRPGRGFTTETVRSAGRYLRLLEARGAAFSLLGRLEALEARPLSQDSEGRPRRDRGQQANIDELLDMTRRAAARAQRLGARDADLVFLSFESDPISGPGHAPVETLIWARRVGQRAVGRRGRARVEDAWRLYVEGLAVLEGSRRQVAAAGRRRAREARALLEVRIADLDRAARAPLPDS